MNENTFFNAWPDTIEDNLPLIDKLGGPEGYNHYPTGWAVAFSTPFRSGSWPRPWRATHADRCGAAAWAAPHGPSPEVDQAVAATGATPLPTRLNCTCA